MLVSIGKRNNRIRTRVLFGTMTLLLAITIPVFAGRAPQDQPGSHMKAMKVPETAADHQEMAEHYQKQAAELRMDIEMHKQMLTDFNKGVASNPKSGENPYSKNMRLHCEKYIAAEQNLEQEAVASAKFHDLEAKQMQGK